MSHKRTIYVGGIDEAASEETLIQAFSTFGEVSDVQIPRDGPDHRGYAFVTFSAENEAEDAIDNMNMNELRGVRATCLYQNMLTVKLAKPQKMMLDSEMSRAVWNNDTWLDQYTQGKDDAIPGLEGDA
ncbi:peptidylprolyl isomerase [Malassezia cuniculi]|uniref:Peptidylprolyl isomerase n=1 Tax=Malassezia cuniculi TaxID=948313 RepID=A0AAF0EPF4_9BASI|nr:peptidylprolyl isomerase [Malassezia cuniculi]